MSVDAEVWVLDDDLATRCSHLIALPGRRHATRQQQRQYLAVQRLPGRKSRRLRSVLGLRPAAR